ncbi:hypothetical protein JMI89_04970 [Frischella sp. Ac48]|uniref:Uncharacterized protein n=1 Tax=Frischella japonica TaxID=2741544 RepID=A0ABR7QUV2_9GAMM|nr:MULTISPECIES: hypothetical protein [Frischella]MBC9129996.1 hypothetical protein [Frischella japonica]MBX4132979.1 hypothetical protein [Frischella sp. Ac48]
MKTILGLNIRVYIQHFLFGIVIFIAVYIFALTPISGIKINVPLLLNFSINTLLYPFSRYAYEAILNYIFSEKTAIWVNIKLFMIIKFFTILLCWGLAIIIAPIGLIIILINFLINKTTSNK